MTALRCTAKLLKLLRQPAKPPEPTSQQNPLGEWYADLEVWRRNPFVVLFNAATGAVLVLRGNAAGLRDLHEHALLQFSFLCEHFAVRGAAVDAELHGFHAGFDCAATRDRSLLGTLNERKFAVRMGFELRELSLFDAAATQWNGLFKHAALGRDERFNSEYHRPLDLVRQRLMSSAVVHSFEPPRR